MACPNDESPDKVVEDWQQNVRAGYDCWAAQYDDADPSTRLDEPAVMHWCGDVAGMCVLDVGCGTGRYAQLLNEAGAHIVGIDLSRAMLMRATRRGLRRGSWVQANAEALPFAAASFERVVSGLVLDHLPQLDRLMGELARVLRPEGRGVLVGVHPVAQQRSGPSVVFHDHGRRHRIPGVIHQPAQVRAAAQRAGLTIVHEQTLKLDEHAIEQAPAWRPRVGEPALMLVVMDKPGDMRRRAPFNARDP